MPKAHSGKRLLNLPQAAEYSARSYERGVEEGRREMKEEMLRNSKELVDNEDNSERDTNEKEQ